MIKKLEIVSVNPLLIDYLYDNVNNFRDVMYAKNIYDYSRWEWGRPYLKSDLKLGDDNYSLIFPICHVDKEKIQNFKKYHESWLYILDEKRKEVINISSMLIVPNSELKENKGLNHETYKCIKKLLNSDSALDRFNKQVMKMMSISLKYNNISFDTLDGNITKFYNFMDPIKLANLTNNQVTNIKQFKNIFFDNISHEYWETVFKDSDFSFYGNFFKMYCGYLSDLTYENFSKFNLQLLRNDFIKDYKLHDHVPSNDLNYANNIALIYQLSNKFTNLSDNEKFVYNINKNLYLKNLIPTPQLDYTKLNKELASPSLQLSFENGEKMKFNYKSYSYNILKNTFDICCVPINEEKDRFAFYKIKGICFNDSSLKLEDSKIDSKKFTLLESDQDIQKVIDDYNNNNNSGNSNNSGNIDDDEMIHKK